MRVELRCGEQNDGHQKRFRREMGNCTHQKGRCFRQTGEKSFRSTEQKGDGSE